MWRNVATASFTLQPSLIVDDLVDHKQLMLNDWIRRVHVIESGAHDDVRNLEALSKICTPRNGAKQAPGILLELFSDVPCRHQIPNSILSTRYRVKRDAVALSQGGLRHL